MSELRVHNLPQQVPANELAGGTVVVIDLLRASTTICQALASGAIEVVPFLEVADTLAAAEAADDRTQIVLGGERGGRQIDGFELGNSPAEYTPGAVRGRRVFITTTNGTRALDHARQADRVFVGALVNLSAVAASIGHAARVDVLCAGTGGRATREDMLAAGALVERLRDVSPTTWQTNAAADSARQEWKSVVDAGRVSPRPLGELVAMELRETPGGRNLLAIGLEGDLADCARIDALDAVPELDVRRWRIVLP